MSVSHPDPHSAFGERLVVEPEPQIQLQYNYVVNTRQLVETNAGTGGASIENYMIKLSTGTTTASTCLIESKRAIKYYNGSGISVRFTAIFTTGVASTEQEIGVGDDQDGLFFGYDGSNFYINRRQGGTDNKIIQSQWNLDKSPDLDITKGNVYQIAYQWLGFGAIIYSIEDNWSGQFEPVHIIRYANTNTVPTINNPSLPMRMFVDNSGTTSDIVLRSASFGAFTEGQIKILGPIFSANNSKASVTTELNILTVQNKATYQSKTNRINQILKSLSLSTEGSKPVTFKIYLNTTLGGSPSYTDVDATNSAMSYDIAGTTITGGDLILSVVLAKSDSKLLDLSKYNLTLSPGDILTVSATSSVATEAFCGITWQEN